MTWQLSRKKKKPPQEKTQKVLAESTGSLQSDVSKHVHGKLTGTEKWCGKRCTSNRDGRSQFKSQSVHQEPSHRRLQEIGYIPGVKPLLNPGQYQRACYLGWGKKNWSKASFQKLTSAFDLEIKVLESDGIVDRRRMQAARHLVWSFHSPWWFGVLCHLPVLFHCSHLPGHFSTWASISPRQYHRLTALMN